MHISMCVYMCLIMCKQMMLMYEIYFQYACVNVCEVCVCVCVCVYVHACEYVQAKMRIFRIMNTEFKTPHLIYLSSFSFVNWPTMHALVETEQYVPYRHNDICLWVVYVYMCVHESMQAQVHMCVHLCEYVCVFVFVYVHGCLLYVWVGRVCAVFLASWCKFKLVMMCFQSPVS